MAEILARAAAVWFIMVAAAILNGLLRDGLLAPLLGSAVSLPLSGLTLSLLIFLVTYVFINFIGVTQAKTCFLVGFFWLVLTLTFEYLFGHYVAGRPWAEINQVFKLAKGNLFIVVLLVTVLSPWLAAKLKNLI